MSQVSPAFSRYLEIGDRRIVDEMIIECVPDDTQTRPECEDCAFFDKFSFCKVFLCGANLRKDGKNVHFVEVLDGDGLNDNNTNL